MFAGDRRVRPRRTESEADAEVFTEEQIVMALRQAEADTPFLQSRSEWWLGEGRTQGEATLSPRTSVSFKWIDGHPACL
jgi:hypothetical protein